MERVHEIARNVEFVGFRDVSDFVASLVLVRPTDAQAHYGRTRQQVHQVYWRSGKWSRAFGEYSPDGSTLDAVWVGTNRAAGVMLLRAKK